MTEAEQDAAIADLQSRMAAIETTVATVVTKLHQTIQCLLYNLYGSPYVPTDF